MHSFVADLHIETSVIGGPRRIPAMAGSVVKTTEFVYGYVNGPEKKIMKQPKYDYIPGYDTHYSLFWNGNRFVKFVDVIKTNKEVVKIFDALNLKVSLNNLSKIIQVSDIVQKWVYSDEIAMNIYRKGDDTIDIPQNILKEYEVPATFFVVGAWVDKYPESVKALHDAGHEIMNHSDSHPHMTKISEEKIH